MIQVGAVLSSNNYGDFVVTSVKNLGNIGVKFLNTGYETVTNKFCIETGSIRDKYAPTNCGFGILDIKKNSEPVFVYRMWNDMLRRCYNNSGRSREVAYIGCTVAEDFRRFSDFVDWCKSQVGFGVEGFQLDKDLLLKGNKVYSKDACVFLPRALNTALTTSKAVRGAYPVGVCYHKATGKFAAYGVVEGSRGYLGLFDNPDEAFEAYKIVREKHLKDLAERYKEVIDPRAYEALLNYKVEITD